MYWFRSRNALLCAAVLVLTGAQAGVAGVLLPDLETFETDWLEGTLTLTAPSEDASPETPPVEPRVVMPPRKAAPTSSHGTVIATSCGPAMIAPPTPLVESDIIFSLPPDPPAAFDHLTPTNIYRPPRTAT